jgi:protein SCO1/2
MAVLAAAMEQLTPEERDQITVLFATSDPRRDTPEVLDRYLAQFDPAFIGLTGTEEQMADLVGFLGLPATEYTEVDDAGNYEVGHASFIIAYDRETNLGHLAYPSGYSTDAVVNDLVLLVNEGYSEPS